MNEEWIFSAEPRRRFLKKIGFPSEIGAFLDTAAERVGGNSALRGLFREEVVRFRSGELNASVHADDWGWCGLLVLDGLPRMLADHAGTGIDFAISQATACDLSRWIADHHANRTPRRELPLSWFQNHLRHGLLEIGRLQFLPRPFAGCVRVYQKPGSPPMALAGAGIVCTSSGWPDPSGPGFVTSLEESPSAVIGHPVDPLIGCIKRTPQRLNLPEWSLLLGPGDPVLDVHVPSGDPLRPEACRRAFSAATDVFGRCMPQTAWRAFTCTSWLLDRELHHCLPPESGILDFGKLFRPFPSKTTNSRELIERVFANADDWRTFPARTSLQLAAKAHLLGGGTFRTTSGYLLRERLFSTT